MNASLSRGTIASCLWLSLIAAACWASGVHAHEVRPAYLEIRETSPDTFDIIWKVPARGEYRLSLHVRLPGECSGAPLHGTFVGDAFIEQWQARCPGGLVGRTIAPERIDGNAHATLVGRGRVSNHAGSIYGASRRSGSTSRPLYVLQLGQTRCGRLGCLQVGQTWRRGTEIPCWARRLSRLDLDVFRFGTAMSGWGV